jgi:hypothetical protein
MPVNDSTQQSSVVEHSAATARTHQQFLNNRKCFDKTQPSHWLILVACLVLRMVDGDYSLETIAFF